MKRMYDFSRTPAQRNYTVADLQALKNSDRKLSMSNPANATEIRACVEAGIDKTSIVTFSLGSGNAGDVIMSFVADICGEPSEEDKPPKHAHAFGDLGRLHRQMYAERVAALKAFHTEVTAKNFPYPETSICMHPEEKDRFLEALDKLS